MLESKFKAMADIEIRKLSKVEITEMDITSWPIWEKEESEFPWHYDNKEECLIIEGAIKVDANNSTYTIEAGDYVVFPKGLSCTWRVLKAVKKHYRFS